MPEELILTPDELYYLGLLLDGKYVDYTYFSLLGDYESNTDSYLDEIKNSLIEKSIISEGFDGSMEVDESAILLVGPVFYGDFESTIDIINGKDDASVSYKFHYAGEHITKVTFLEGNQLKVEKICVDNVPDVLTVLSEVQVKEETPNFDEDKVIKTVVLKNQLVEQFSFEDILFCCENGFFMTNSKEELVNIGLEKAINVAGRILMGKE